MTQRNLLNLVALTLAVVSWPSARNAFARPGAQDFTYEPYQIGTPTLQDVWVDPVNGSDANSGATRATALQSITEAWNRIPRASTLTTGYRLQLVAGTYGVALQPNYWEERWGTFQHPVILNAVDGDGTAVLTSVNFFDCDYLYLIGLRIQDPGGDVVHAEQCSYFLMRRSTVRGDRVNVQETVKINQSNHVYIEECDISGANDNAIDWVAVQYGHVLASRIHDSQSWAMYAKGGSAYIRVEGNEIYDADEGGFTAGQGTGFEFMTDPWLHYEAYDVKFINNVIHDIVGPGFGTNGGYNILLAYNTAYRVGSRSHLFESEFGARSCDGNTVQCQQNLNRGGWGTATVGNTEYIPDHRVYVYNNIIYNPAPFQSQWQHFQIPDPRNPSPGSNIPDPSVTDDDLRIRGNIIWNGPPSHPLGIEGTQACQAGNPTCNETQLRADNAINTLEPQLVDPANGNFRPVAGGNVFSVTTYAIPSFPGGDWPQPPSPPPYPGDLTNDVAVDRDGNPRTGTGPPGAYTGATVEKLVAGAGPVAATPAVVTVFGVSGTTYAQFTAYGGGYGANVATGSLNPNAYHEILTGPGPGAVYGPQVKAYENTGTPIAKVNFYAYATLRYGVGVAAAALDADGLEEILTGAGPGAVFGPHVRGFNFDNTSLTAIAKVSFFAYGTLRYGVHATGGRVDGDGYDEILTGPGPSGAFGAQLRGFNYDGSIVTSLSGINAVVLNAGARYGLYPAAGDVDPDAFDEILVGNGPDPAGSSSVQLLNYDGAALSSLTLQTIWGSPAWGVRGFLGEIDGDAYDEIVVSAQGSATGTTATPQVRGFNWDGASWTPMTLPSFDAYPGIGAKVGGPFDASY